MRRSGLVILVVMVFASALAGCSSSGRTVPQPTVTVTQTVAPVYTPEPEKPARDNTNDAFYKEIFNNLKAQGFPVIYVREATGFAVPSLAIFKIKACSGPYPVVGGEGSPDRWGPILPDGYSAVTWATFKKACALGKG